MPETWVVGIVIVFRIGEDESACLQRLRYTTTRRGGSEKDSPICSMCRLPDIRTYLKHPEGNVSWKNSGWIRPPNQQYHMQHGRRSGLGAMAARKGYFAMLRATFYVVEPRSDTGPTASKCVAKRGWGRRPMLNLAVLMKSTRHKQTSGCVTNYRRYDPWN